MNYNLVWMKASDQWILQMMYSWLTIIGEWLVVVVFIDQGSKQIQSKITIIAKYISYINEIRITNGNPTYNWKTSCTSWVFHVNCAVNVEFGTQSGITWVAKESLFIERHIFLFLTWKQTLFALFPNVTKVGLFQLVLWYNEISKHYLFPAIWYSHAVACNNTTYFFNMRASYSSMIYHQVSNINCTLVGNKLVDHSDVVGVSPVGAAPTTSSFLTYYLASIAWEMTTAFLAYWCNLF